MHRSPNPGRGGCHSPGGGEIEKDVRQPSYGHTFFGFLPIENVFGSADTNS